MFCHELKIKVGRVQWELRRRDGGRPEAFETMIMVGSRANLLTSGYFWRTIQRLGRCEQKRRILHCPRRRRPPLLPIKDFRSVIPNEFAG